MNFQNIILMQYAIAFSTFATCVKHNNIFIARLFHQNHSMWLFAHTIESAGTNSQLRQITHSMTDLTQGTYVKVIRQCQQVLDKMGNWC